MDFSEYFEGFDNKSEICSNFEIPKDSLNTAVMLHVQYGTYSYEGYADVLYIENSKLYEVHGSHCSCHGLEGQWDPEETFPEAAIKNEKFKNNPLLQALVNKEITIAEIYSQIHLKTYLNTHISKIKSSDLSYVTSAFKQNPDMFINPPTEVLELIENLDYPYLLLAHLATNPTFVNKLTTLTLAAPN